MTQTTNLFYSGCPMALPWIGLMEASKSHEPHSHVHTGHEDISVINKR